jgi:hypothetical protein
MLDVAISIKYMLAGYVLIFSVLAIYIISLFIRWRGLMRDQRTIKEFQKKE